MTNTNWEQRSMNISGEETPESMQSALNPIVWFSDESSSDITRLGGKDASLEQPEASFAGHQESFLNIRGDDGLEVYAMCEIPSMVILAEKFAECFDGFSIGSNDLTQLT
jgi:phosphoenolpyruvate synthase/pyruvate phosphate dikinase